MTARTSWAELPGPARAAVEQITGPVLDAVDVEGGLTCSMAARLVTACGDLFVKGCPTGSEEAGQQAVEAAVAAYLPGCAPRVIAAAGGGGWDLLATAWVDGRHADLSPGSPDLGAVARALADTTEHRPPGAPPVPALADRWAANATPGEAALLGGGHLVHADVHPHNVLVGGGRAWLVDWAMCGRGPAWVDVACAALRLVEDGHTGADALAWAARVPAWRAADPAAVGAWVEVSCREWVAVMGEADARRGVERLRSLAPEGARA